MPNFKLVAIRANKHCHKDFRKNLEEGEFYKFYNNYIFLNKDEQPLKKGESIGKIVLENQDASESLFNVKTLDKREIFLNISAVAGRNGSGKSTLVELFFAIVFVFSECAGVMDHNSKNLKKQKELKESELEILRQKDSSEKIYKKITKLIHQPSHKLPRFESLRLKFRDYEDAILSDYGKTQAINDRISEIDSDLEEIARIVKQLKAEVIFRASNTFFSLTVDNELTDGFQFSKLDTVGEENDPDIISLARDIQVGKILDIRKAVSKLFFYTIAINYSSYSLNSNVIGEWISALFHKNDGYKTPLVINPMRTEGHFNVNKENHFAKYRLLSNLLVSCKEKAKDSPLFLTEMQSVKSVCFTLNEQKVGQYKVLDNGNFLRGGAVEIDLINALYEQFIPYSVIGRVRAELGDETFNLVSNYLLQKMDKMSTIYEGFFYPNDTNEAYALAQKIKNDDSHVTFKMRQAINFIIHCFYNKGKKKNFIRENNSLAVSVEFTPYELLLWMGSPDYGEIINHLPPSLFSIDIELKSNAGEVSRFDLMSSGEQQFIHVLHCVLYHVNNLQSVSNVENRLSYNSVNIIFDEVELYFHPDLQRRFVKEFREAIGRLYLQGKKGISSINILFLTHSPFILSDIPASNLLLLDRGVEGKTVVKKIVHQTFAANINDLLADNFFLDQTLIGAFAEQKIEKLIEKISNGKYNAKDDGWLTELIGDSFLKASITNFIKNR